jgi:hypothetical protein
MPAYDWHLKITHFNQLDGIVRVEFSNLILMYFKNYIGFNNYELLNIYDKTDVMSYMK